MNNADGFDDLNALRLPPEGVAAAKSSADAPKRARRRRVPIGDFYLCPVVWADRAASAVASKDQLIIAFRLYRCWRLRKPGESMIIASNTALVGPGFSREKKRRTIQRLQAAGILEVVTHKAPRAPRIRIIE
jgi:hypothetical protein